MVELYRLGLNRAQRGNAGHWREGDVAHFHRGLPQYRIPKGDACAVTKVGEGRIRLAHPGGRPRGRGLQSRGSSCAWDFESGLRIQGVKSPSRFLTHFRPFSIGLMRFSRFQTR